MIVPLQSFGPNSCRFHGSLKLAMSLKCVLCCLICSLLSTLLCSYFQRVKWINIIIAIIHHVSMCISMLHSFQKLVLSCHFWIVILLINTCSQRKWLRALALAPSPNISPRLCYIRVFFGMSLMLYVFRFLSLVLVL